MRHSTEGAHRRIDELVRELEDVVAWADRDDRDMALLYVIRAWRALPADADVWDAMSNLLAVPVEGYLREEPLAQLFLADALDVMRLLPRLADPDGDGPHGAGPGYARLVGAVSRMQTMVPGFEPGPCDPDCPLCRDESA